MRSFSYSSGGALLLKLISIFFPLAYCFHASNVARAGSAPLLLSFSRPVVKIRFWRDGLVKRKRVLRRKCCWNMEGRAFYCFTSERACPRRSNNIHTLMTIFEVMPVALFNVFNAAAIVRARKKWKMKDRLTNDGQEKKDIRPHTQEKEPRVECAAKEAWCVLVHENGS